MSKRNKKHKKDRRIREAQIAQAKSDGRIVQNVRNTYTAVEKLTVPAKQEEPGIAGKFTLPIKEIKVDLIKNAAFAIISVAALVLLKITGFGAEFFSSFFRF